MFTCFKRLRRPGLIEKEAEVSPFILRYNLSEVALLSLTYANGAVVENIDHFPVQSGKVIRLLRIAERPMKLKVVTGKRVKQLTISNKVRECTIKETEEHEIEFVEVNHLTKHNENK